MHVEVAHLELEQRRQQLGVVDIRAVGGVLVASGARVDADPFAFLPREAVQDAVDQVDERPQELLGRIELHREPPFSEVDLDVVGPGLERSSDVRLGLLHQIGDERVMRIAFHAVQRIEQGQGGGRDHSLLERPRGVPFRPLEIGPDVRRVPEGPGGQPWELASVSVRERDDHAVRCEIPQPLERIGGEGRFGLLTVGDDR